MRATKVLVMLSLLAAGAQACIHLMGDSLDSLAAHPSFHWTYGFRGDDWATGSCLNGTTQSPINIPVSPDSKLVGAAERRTEWSYTAATSNGSDIEVYNNGHTIQVQWAPGTIQSAVSVKAATGNVLDVLNNATDNAAFTSVPATPLQFHFHTASEHTVDGVYYPMEMHIVHNVAQSDLPGCPDGGCFMVTGIMFKLAEDDQDNQALEAIWEAMSMREGVKTPLPAGAVLDIEALLPEAENRAYSQYQGSLTTPPCSEGLLWHVFDEPQTMSLRQFNKYSMAVGLKECVEKEDDDVPAITRRLLSKPQNTRAPFVRGSYTGFVQEPVKTWSAAAGRALLQEEEDPEAWNCTVVSYGFTNRNVQPVGDRSVFHYA